MRRILVGLLIAVLISAVWYFFVVGPINERKETAQIDLETAQTEEFTLRTTLSRLQKIEENQLEYATAIGQLETGIPSTPRLAELIDDLNYLADENGLAWTSGSYTVPNLIQGTEVFEIGVTVQVQGQFFEILGYLYGIADLDRIVRIDSLTLSASTDEAGFHSMNATISGVVFTTSEVVIPLELSSLLPAEPAADEAPAEDAPAEDAPAEEPAAGADGSTETTTTTVGG
ncbi:MAG: type 4a pilus biogenesis protein PilO [Acidimicrobiia bacterium]|nr:type 4a pilus biogenesis protein PilO [Acidimicrobiia bacterium]